MANVPAGVKQPQDRKKPAEPQDRAPASAYADDTQVQVTYDGQTYTAHPERVLKDIDAFEAFSNIQAQAAGPAHELTIAEAMQQARDIITVGAALLGDAYARFKADQKRLHGYCSVLALMEVLQAAFDEGNSPASPTS